MGRRSRSQVVAAVVAMACLAACARGDRVVALQAEDSLAEGEVRFVLGPSSEPPFGDCEEALVRVAAQGEQIAVTVQPCMTTGGYDAAPGIDERFGEPFVTTIGGRDQGSRSPVAISPDPGGSDFVTDLAEDGRLLMISGRQVVVVDPSRSSETVLSLDRLPSVGQGVVIPDYIRVSDGAFGPDGSVFASVGSGIVEVDGAGTRWLLPYVSDDGVFTPRIDGAQVPQVPGEPINDLAVSEDGSVLFVMDQGLFRLRSDGAVVPLLTPETPAPAEAALVARAVEVDGQLSVCCGGSQLTSVVVDDDGWIVVLDFFTGRLISVGPDGSVSKLGGVELERNPCLIDCSLVELLAESPELASASELSFQPVVAASGGGNLAFTEEGSLLVAMGSFGLFEVGLRR